MSRPQEILDDLEQRHPHAYTLAVRLALAVRIDPAYLRAIRLHFVPEADTDDELALWTSALVRSKGYDGFVFTHAVNDQLRAELEKNRELWQKVWELTERLHRGEPPSLVAEERIRYAAMRVSYEGPGMLDEEIRKVLDWRQVEADKLNRFGAYLLPTLPEAAARSAEAWRLEDIVKDYPGFRGGLKGKADARLYKEGLGLDINRLKKRSLFVRHAGTSLIFSTEPMDALAIEVPDTNPIELELRWDEPTYLDGTATFDGSIDHSGQRHRKERLVVQAGRGGTEIQVGEGKVLVKTLAGDEFEFQTLFSRLVEEVQKALRYLGEYEGPVNGWLKSLGYHWGDELPVAAVDTAALEQYLATLRPKLLGTRGIKLFVDFSRKSVDVLAAWLRPLFAFYHVDWNDPVKGFKPGINLESSIRHDLADIDLYLMVLEKDTPQTVMRQVHESVSPLHVKTKLISILYGDAKMEGSGLESREIIPRSGQPLDSMPVADSECVLQMALGSIFKQLHEQHSAEAETKKEIFISYKREPASERLALDLKVLIEAHFPFLKVMLDTKEVRTGASIKAYMDRLAQGNYIIFLLSPAFLDSHWCMYELALTADYPDFKERVFHVRMPGVQIGTPNEVAKIAKAWKERYAELKADMEDIAEIDEAQLAPEFADQLRIMGAIVRGSSRALLHLLDTTGLSADANGMINWTELLAYLKEWIQPPLTTLHPEIQKLLDDMVFVKGGSFMMGSEEADREASSDEKPKHEVHLSDYYIGKYPVTQAQWEAVMGTNPSHFQGCPDCPVEQVSWNYCQVFLQRLNSLTGQRFNLPTEAQWEYAARGGQPGNVQNYQYAGSSDAYKVAWCYGNSEQKTHPVGGKDPNALGLHDMIGNVWEWCRDRYDSEYYQKWKDKAAVDPMGPIKGESFVLRGGSWDVNPRYCRVAFRGFNLADFHGYLVGVRVQRE